ncbi:MAG: proline--tRNA ligase [Anaerorhabdus sp.]
MKLKNSYFYTLREDVKDEDSLSSNLLVRAGMIKKSSAGVYMFLPLGLKIIKNIEKVIHEEMIKIGCQEVLMPSLIPEEIYISSGRRNGFGKGMFTLKDRFDKSFVLGPTHEELFSAAASSNVQSYKDLPFMLYQIQNKFRDEPRPRFGLIRVREFLMKDAYTFDDSEESLNHSYNLQYNAYKNIFDRLKVNYKIVTADTGVMGGLLSEEFQAVSDIGEDTLVLCHKCDYASNLEVSKCIPTEQMCTDKKLDKILTQTLNVKTIDEVSEFLSVEKKSLVKSIAYMVDDVPYICLVSGIHDVNEVKLRKLLQADEVRMAEENEVVDIFKSVPGFIGPIDAKCKIIVDQEVMKKVNFVVGANKKDYHYINVNLEDFDVYKDSDIRQVQEEDICPNCGDKLYFSRGIEVGNTFKLGTKYSEIMNLKFSNSENKLMPVWMGSYGIGLARTMAAIAEQKCDDKGLNWPLIIAPYKVAIVIVSTKDEEQVNAANNLYDKLCNANISCILDDRDERVGIKFKDMELIGIPYRITVGRDIVNNKVELKGRNDTESILIKIEDCISVMEEIIKKEI